MKTTHRTRNIVIAILVAAAIVAVLVIGNSLTRVKLYADESTTGNSSGNLLNGGLFCAAGGYIYFANPYDENTLYRMDENFENLKQISTDNVSYLNIAGNYIFYTKRNDQKEIDSESFMALQSTGLYRMKLSGKNIGQLYKNPTQVACLYGNYVYYQHYDNTNGLWLYRAKIDGSEDALLLEDACAPYAISGDTIYYTGYRNDHSIRAISTDGSADRVLFSGNFTGLTMQGDYLYFLDMADDYALKRFSIDTDEVETLVSARLATYNVSENGRVLYCQIDNGTEDNGLYEYNIDNGTLNLIAAGNYNYLHLTDNYLFYETYDQSSLYIMNLATNQSQLWTMPTE